jgi:hypothetical protein
MIRFKFIVKVAHEIEVTAKTLEEAQSRADQYGALDAIGQSGASGSYWRIGKPKLSEVEELEPRKDAHAHHG